MNRHRVTTATDSLFRVENDGLLPNIAECGSRTKTYDAGDIHSWVDV
jgi:hypothetical protein